MAALKTVAVATAFVGWSSLAFAQGPGIAPNGANLPPQTNTQGTAQSTPSMGQSTHMKKKKSHHLYNMATKKKQRPASTSK